MALTNSEIVRWSYRIFAVLLTFLMFYTQIIIIPAQAFVPFIVPVAPEIAEAIALGLVAVGVIAADAATERGLTQAVWDGLSQAGQAAWAGAGAALERGWVLTQSMYDSLMGVNNSIINGTRTNLDYFEDNINASVTGNSGVMNYVSVYSGNQKPGTIQYRIIHPAGTLYNGNIYIKYQYQFWVGPETSAGLRYTVNVSSVRNATTQASVSASVTVVRSDGTGGSSVTQYNPTVTAGQSDAYERASVQTNDDGTAKITVGGWSQTVYGSNWDTMGQRAGANGQYYGAGYTNATLTIKMFEKKSIDTGGVSYQPEQAIPMPVGRTFTKPTGWTYPDSYVNQAGVDLPAGTVSQNNQVDSTPGWLEQIYDRLGTLPGLIGGALSDLWAEPSSIFNTIADGIGSVYEAVISLPNAISDAITGGLEGLFVPSQPLSYYWNAVEAAYSDKVPFAFIGFLSGVFAGSAGGDIDGWSFPLTYYQNQPNHFVEINMSSYSGWWQWERTILSALIYAGGLYAALRLLGWGSDSDNG